MKIQGPTHGILFHSIRNAEPINNWNEVPDGAFVIEDTYNELYVLKHDKDMQFPILLHVGWQVSFGKPEKFVDRPLGKPRLADFEPNCMYDQPWYMETK